MNRRKSIAAGALLAFFLVPIFVMAQTSEKEEFAGNVYWVAAGPASGQTSRLTMTVERWTTDEERMELYTILKDKGSDELLKAMRKTTVGYLRFTGTIRYPLNIASSFQTEKGRLIRLICERPIQPAELMGRTPARTRDYEFGVIEFTLDESGKGEGTMIPTAKIMLNEEGQIVVETLGTGPQKLLNVKTLK
jgi:hypothetical protein